jgi:hypothetical protein
MVGMPGRGKSGIAQRTAHYLRFFHGVDCKVFSTAAKRREAIGYADNTWYDDQRTDQKDMMRKWFLETMDDLKVCVYNCMRCCSLLSSCMCHQQKNIEKTSNNKTTKPKINQPINQ